MKKVVGKKKKHLILRMIEGNAREIWTEAEENIWKMNWKVVNDQEKNKLPKRNVAEKDHSSHQKD